MSGRQTTEASPDVVTGILTVQSHDAYALIHLGSTLSYVTPFVAMEFGKEPEKLHEPFSVSTSVSESILATQVYRSCVVTVCGRDTMADFIELGMVDFDVIMGMNWLYSCFSKLDCRTRTMRLEFPNEPAIEWEGDNVVPRDELPRIPPYREIDFGIDVMPVMQPISIPPYRMAPTELKELKEQLKDLLEKEGIMVDPQKITTVKNWPRLTTPMEICSFLGKANVVADTLSRKSMGSLAHLEACQRPLAREVYQLASLGVRLADYNEGGVIVQNRVESSLMAKGNWDDRLPLIEFAYNNSFHASIQMEPFEALYGRICSSPIGWFEVGEAELIVSDLVHQAMEKVKIIKERLKTAQSRQKFYLDVRRRDLEFKEDDWASWKLRNKEIASVKVSWWNQQVEEATWEAEDEMKKYPHLFE
ncbi:uncharacterized protein [Nicotiana sylvestris]|uniref:uncharacterized protein n=1 Tax=Nicotiana sylvestris TaxID=4096 RepID=UPI00388C7024